MKGRRVESSRWLLLRLGFALWAAIAECAPAGGRRHASRQQPSTTEERGAELPEHRPRRDTAGATRAAPSLRAAEKRPRPVCSVQVGNESLRYGVRGWRTASGRRAAVVVGEDGQWHWLAAQDAAAAFWNVLGASEKAPLCGAPSGPPPPFVVQLTRKEAHALGEGEHVDLADGRLWRRGEAPKGCVVVSAGEGGKPRYRPRQLLWVNRLGAIPGLLVVIWQLRPAPAVTYESRWRVVFGEANGNPKVGRECGPYLRHALATHADPANVTFFMQDDSDDEESHKGKSWHTFRPDQRVAAVMRAERLPQFLPLSSWPGGPVNTVNDSTRESLGFRKVGYGVDSLHRPVTLYGPEERLVRILLAPGEEVPDQFLGWKNALFLAGRERIRAVPIATLSAVARLLALHTYYCASLEPTWHFIFGGCGARWTTCETKCGRVDCGDCRVVPLPRVEHARLGVNDTALRRQCHKVHHEPPGPEWPNNSYRSPACGHTMVECRSRDRRNRWLVRGRRPAKIEHRAINGTAASRAARSASGLRWQR